VKGMRTPWHWIVSYQESKPLAAQGQRSREEAAQGFSVTPSLVCRMDGSDGHTTTTPGPLPTSWASCYPSALQCTGPRGGGQRHTAALGAVGRLRPVPPSPGPSAVLSFKGSRAIALVTSWAMYCSPPSPLAMWPSRLGLPAPFLAFSQPTLSVLGPLGWAPGETGLRLQWAPLTERAQPLTVEPSAVCEKGQRERARGREGEGGWEGVKKNRFSRVGDWLEPRVEGLWGIHSAPCALCMRAPPRARCHYSDEAPPRQSLLPREGRGGKGGAGAEGGARFPPTLSSSPGSIQ